MTKFILLYALSIVLALSAWIMANRERRQALRDDLVELSLALYSFTLWLTAYPQTLWRLHHYRPRHARYAPASRAWSVTL